MASTNFINECKNRANANRLGKITILSERDSYNLLPNNAKSQTINGVTFTVNDDGTVLADGISTETTYLYFDIEPFTLKAGSYILSNGLPKSNEYKNFNLQLTVRSNSNTGTITYNASYYDYNIKVDSDVTVENADIQVPKDLQITNILFKPMLRLASITDNTYEQYGKKYPITEEITNSDKLQSIDIDSGCYVDGNIIGSVYAKCLNANFVGNINDLAEKNMCAKIGVKYADLSTEYINMGKYTIERPNNEITAQYSQIKAYSKLYSNLDKPYICNIDYLSGKKTLTDLYIDVCNQLGLTPKTTDILNGNIPITDNPFTNNEKNRIVLQTICKISCSFADIDDDTNEIELNWLSTSETPDYTFMKNDYVSVDGGEIVCGPINTLIIKSSQVDDENLTKQDLESIAENGEHSITISDDYILYNDSLREQAINNIWNRVNGLKYVDCKLTTYYGKPFLKIGNKIRIYTSDTDYFDTYVLKHKFTYDGAFSSIIESPVLTQQEVNHKQDISISQAVRYAQINIDKQKGSIEELVGEINNVNLKENNNYQEITKKFDNYVPKESIVSIENSVKKITENTYTKTEINTKLIDGSVEKVVSTSGTFDENGLTIDKTNAPTRGNFNHKGMKVENANSKEELLFAGFDEELNQTIVRSENMNVRKYLNIGKNSRIEDYKTDRTGVFYVGE